MNDLISLLQRLIDAKIDFVLVGGMAAVAHGSSQTTRDIDICISITDSSLEQLRECLKDLDPVHRMVPNRVSFMDHPPKAGKWNNIYLRTTLGVLDVISEVAGVGKFEALDKNAELRDFFGKKLKIISLDDLITAKNLLGRDKDLIVARELEIIRAALGKEK